jgi:RimJ/RimL family protein N-acetyltransferase
VLRLDELIAIIHPQNLRSRRVAANLGMALEQRAPSEALGFEVEIWQLRGPTGP